MSLVRRSQPCRDLDMFFDKGKSKCKVPEIRKSLAFLFCFVLFLEYKEDQLI